MDLGSLYWPMARLDAEILKAQKGGTAAAGLGKRDASDAIAAARREHFPARAILFLDQEEGGRLLDEQAAYLFAWTEAVGRSEYLPGVYASGQPASEGHGVTITTAQDIREHVAKEHLHEIALWVAQDACPPSNGCAGAGAAALGERDAGGCGVAVCAVSTTQVDYGDLRQDLRDRWQLLCPGIAEAFPGFERCWLG